jgi:hypothetical protein
VRLRERKERRRPSRLFTRANKTREERDVLSATICRARFFFRDGFDQNTPPAFRPPRFFRELCQVLGSLHDTLAPLHSRDIQRRDHGRDPEDGRLGPLTFVARPATPLALRRRAGLSRTVPRVARTANREHSSFREASRASARAPAFFFSFSDWLFTSSSRASAS